MASTNHELDEYLASKLPGEFKAVANYFPDGDHACYFISNERCYEQRLDDLVTVYLSMKTDALVGIKIKGVTRILERLGGREFVVAVLKCPVTVSLLLLGAGLIEPESRPRYSDLGARNDLNVVIEIDQFVSAA